MFCHLYGSDICHGVIVNSGDNNTSMATVTKPGYAFTLLVIIGEGENIACQVSRGDPSVLLTTTTGILVDVKLSPVPFTAVITVILPSLRRDH